MTSDRHLSRSRRGTRICRLAGVALVAAGVAAMTAAIFWPIQSSASQKAVPAARNLAWLDEPVLSPEPLVQKLAGRTLVKATQVQAAVKDTGAARELLKRLKLQGVVEMPDGLVAYIAVQGEGVSTCRKGEKVLEFVVEDVAPGKVVLNLQGVQNTLSH